MKYVNVAIDNNNDNTDILYTYACEFDEIKIGNKVYVPFGKGNRTKAAYVFEVLDKISININKIKYIDHIDEEISLNKEIINTCKWIRQQYICRYIDSIKCFTPAGSLSKRGKIRTPYKDFEGEYKSIKDLTMEQSNALDRINPFIEKQEYKTFLIHGVTSSGKTEIYMRAIDKCIKMGRTAIMLVPEISLTTQTIERFIGRFGSENMAVLHSKLSLGERYDEWMRVKKGKVKILIGARSGVFAPFENIGVIILDEEHETTYKSDKTPKYDTVEVAIKRAQQNNGIVLLGSATPSLISSYKAEKGLYEKITLKKRYNEANLPEVQIIDMREELKNGNKTIFSVALYNEICNCLDNEKQVILFLNRRGYSSFISCRSCGYVLKCKECGISLTYHKSNNKAICHFCGYTEDIPEQCPECHGKYIKHFGVGTEKVEEVSKKLFPQSIVERLDLDTTKRKGSIDKIINNFKKGKTHILIGTQLVAKGLDFANVGLVGIISADITLNISDFRAAERTFQLITQAAGRAGRGNESGRVIIQSYSPNHYAILAAAKHDYGEFYKTEKMIRSMLLYPPYSDLIQIIISSEEEEEVQLRSEKVVQDFINKAGNKSKKYIFGPHPAPMNKINNHYRYQLLIKCLPENRLIYTQIITEIKLGISTDRNAKYLISIDINPYSFL
ncbi:replication restart helicase PriA [Anaerovorax odorimutans]|uniref:replication restart helicase PriA n=1 Tax=Anaerovorax odorimutans TaxID=109327 RepID=UPI000428D509|nr:primosomal protein N' [Anaerovorax odorimutans]